MSASRPTPRIMSTSARRRPASSSTFPTCMPKACCSTGCKLYEEGVRNELLWKFIRDNTRVPGLVMGDLEAQIASAELGVQRFQQLMATYGKDTVLQATRQLMDYTESMLRREIAKIPDGDYVAEGFLDDDGRNRGVTLPLKVTVRVRGDGVEVDTDRLLGAGADRLQRALRRLDQGRLLFRLPGAAARYLHARGIHPAERRLVPAGQGRRRRSARSSTRSRRSLQRPASARSSGVVRPDHQGAGAGAARQVHGGQRGRAVLRGLFRRARRAATTGCSSRSTRRRWAAGRCRTGPTRSRN